MDTLTQPEQWNRGTQWINGRIVRDAYVGDKAGGGKTGTIAFGFEKERTQHGGTRFDSNGITAKMSRVVYPPRLEERLEVNVDMGGVAVGLVDWDQEFGGPEEVLAGLADAVCGPGMCDAEDQGGHLPESKQIFLQIGGEISDFHQTAESSLSRGESADIKAGLVETVAAFARIINRSSCEMVGVDDDIVEIVKFDFDES